MTPARRITLLLSGFAVVLAALAVAQYMGLGNGYQLLSGTQRSAETNALSALDRTPFKLDSWADYANVLAHPVFNETREPTPVEAVVADAPVEPTAQPINVTLTSIIMTPKVKLAIVRDNNSGKSEVVKVGMSLEGEQSGWKLVEVRPRGAVFEGQGLGRQDLELFVASATASREATQMPAPTPVAPGMTPTSSPVTTNANNTEAASQTRAEEIRKRIEERRKQLREEAERMRTQESTE